MMHFPSVLIFSTTILQGKTGWGTPNGREVDTLMGCVDTKSRKRKQEDRKEGKKKKER